jgi:hypothetical protein
MTEAKRELNLIETFLMAFYHEHSDLIGTTRALDALRPSPEYRRELGYAFKHLLERELASGTLRLLVREAANRNVQTDDEAREYLRFIYQDNLLNHEIDYEDED